MRSESKFSSYRQPYSKPYEPQNSYVSNRSAVSAVHS